MSPPKFFAMTLHAVMAFAVLAPSAYPQSRPKAPKSVRIYVFDNGVIKDPDVTRFRFKKEEIAAPDFVVCSYLIVHPKCTFMWDTGVISDADREALKYELGDVLWYMAQIATELGLSLDDVAQANIEKLTSRLERNQIQGEGDYR